MKAATQPHGRAGNYRQRGNRQALTRMPAPRTGSSTSSTSATRTSYAPSSEAERARGFATKRGITDAQILRPLQRLDVSIICTQPAGKTNIHNRACARTSGDARMTGVDGVKTFEGYANAKPNDVGVGIGGKLHSTGAQFRS